MTNLQAMCTFYMVWCWWWLIKDHPAHARTTVNVIGYTLLSINSMVLGGALRLGL